jgi:hypothetical protein
MMPPHELPDIRRNFPLCCILASRMEKFAVVVEVASDLDRTKHPCRESTLGDCRAEAGLIAAALRRGAPRVGVDAQLGGDETPVLDGEANR